MIKERSSSFSNHKISIQNFHDGQSSDKVDYMQVQSSSAVMAEAHTKGQGGHQIKRDLILPHTQLKKAPASLPSDSIHLKAPSITLTKSDGNTTVKETRSTESVILPTPITDNVSAYKLKGLMLPHMQVAHPPNSQAHPVKATGVPLVMVPMLII